MSTNYSNRRTRNWTVEVYPSEHWYRNNIFDGLYDGSDGWGSAPDNWKDLLNELNLKWACSPLHYKDIDGNGKIKKPHWHIVICFSGNKSFEQVVEDITEPLFAPIPQPCRDVRGMVRYFIHKDHPHKFQYSKEDIESYGGFDVGDVLKLSKSEKTQLLIDIALFIHDEDIKEYWDLQFYAIYEKPEWVEAIQDNSMYFERLLKSNRHRKRDIDVDLETGEIL